MVIAESSRYMITVVVSLTKAFLIFDWLLTLKIPHFWFLVMLLPQQTLLSFQFAGCILRLFQVDGSAWFSD